MKKLIIGLLITLMVFSLACSSPSTDDSAVATVDGEAITRLAFDRNLALIKYNIMARQGQDYFDQISEEELETLRQNLLSDMIDEHLVLREAKKAGVEPEESDVQEYYEGYMQANFGTEESPSESGKQVRQYLDENNIDDDFIHQMLENDLTIRQYISSIQEKYDNDEAARQQLLDESVAQVKASHILMPHDQKDKIDELYATLSQDPSQFAELAKEHSTDGSAASGGELGQFVRTEMVPEFNDAAFGAEVGVVTEPVESDFGYHLILVEESQTLKDMEAAGEDEARIELARNGIIQDTIRQEYFGNIERWREAAKIETFELK